MHDCSVCGCACYCHGDLDDCQVETPEYAYMHCEGCGCEEYEPDEDYCDFCGGMGGTCTCGREPRQDLPVRTEESEK